MESITILIEENISGISTPNHEILSLCPVSVDEPYPSCSTEGMVNSNHENNDFVEDRKRPYKTCDVCNKKVRHLASNLNTHGLPKEEILEICYLNRLRKPKNINGGRKCPFPSCSRLDKFVRIDKHLQKKHKLQRTHPMYHRFINTYAARVRSPKMETTPGYKPSYSEFSEKISRAFFDYLLTLNGGNFKKSNAKQYFLKVRQIIHGSNIQALEEFESSQVLVKLESWFRDFISVHKETSTTFYVSIFLKFLNFLQFCHPKSSKNYKHLIIAIMNWKKCFKYIKCSSRKGVEDISESELRELEESSAYVLCKDKLNEYKNNSTDPLTVTMHSKIRNFLLVAAILRNSCRSCALTNMKIDELREVNIVEKDNMRFYVVSVTDHKTVREHGPARATLEAELYNFYMIYVEKVRSRVIAVDSNVKTVFITWGGNSITSDHVYHVAQQFWEDNGNRKKLSTTRIRKIIVSRIHSNESNETKEEIARHFCHRSSTAEKDYKRKTEVLQNVSASQKIYKTLHGKDLSLDNFNSQSEPNCIGEESLNVYEDSQYGQEDNEYLDNLTSSNNNGSNHEQNAMNEALSSHMFEDNPEVLSPDIFENNQDPQETEEDLDNLKSGSDQPSLSMENCSERKERKKSSKGRAYFTTKERQLLYNVFQYILLRPAVPSMKTIRKYIEENIRMSVLKKVSKANPIKIKGCLQNLYQKEFKKFK